MDRTHPGSPFLDRYATDRHSRWQACLGLSSVTYRPDIDGLRAAAVLSVILYHLRVPGFGGGFVGVDVFFVISGYLICRLISDEISAGDFSLSRFYERRIRRIFPALLAVVAFCLPITVWLFIADDLLHVGRSIVAMAFFSSNILFWLETGYFEAASQTKPFLHTWSLAVEEQFYVVFPLLLIAMLRFSKRGTGLILGGLTVVSFCTNLVASDPSAAFYLPQYRAWELLMGCIAARLPPLHFSRTTANIMCAGGIMVIFAVIFFGSDIASYPVLTLLAPATLGAMALVLFGGRSDVGAGPLLRLRPVVFLGKISYSAYLWHWPLIVFCTYYYLRDLRPAEKLALLCATLLVSAASWYWIEQPARRVRVSRRFVFSSAAIAMAFLICAGLTIHFTHGVLWRYAAAPALPLELYNIGPCFRDHQTAEPWSSARCTWPGNGASSARVVLWGDSFAAHLLPGLRSLQRDMGFSLTQATFSSCPPLPGLMENIALSPQACNRFNREILQTLLQERPKLVILSSRWETVVDQATLAPAVSSTISRLRAAGISVLVVGVTPTYRNAVGMIDHSLRSRGTSDGWYQPEIKRLEAEKPIRQAALRGGAAFFSPIELLCRGNRCRYSDGKLLQWDFGHLSEHGSNVFARAMRPAISSAVNAEKLDRRYEHLR